MAFPKAKTKHGKDSQGAAFARSSEDSRAPSRLPAARPSKDDAQGGCDTSKMSGRGRRSPDIAAAVISIRLTHDLLAQIDAYVEASGGVYRDRSEFIRQTLAATMLAPQARAARQQKLLREIAGNASELHDRMVRFEVAATPQERKLIVAEVMAAERARSFMDGGLTSHVGVKPMSAKRSRKA